MQRRLVLVTESARHPLRRALPPMEPMPETPRNEDGDVKLFFLSFAAFFTCFYTFIF